jgi:clan AA aspartic protease (TIGR02281 family)
MDRTFGRWFVVPTFVATVCLVVVAYFAPTLFSDSTFLVITFSVLGLANVVGCIFAFLSIKAGNASPLVAMHPGFLLPFVVIFGLIADVWGVRSALWQYATTSSLETEGIWFARSGDGQFRPRVSVNGNLLQVVVDPESRHILLSRADATRIGIDLSALTFDAPIDGPDGPQSAAAISLRKVQLASISMTDVPAFVPERDLAISVLGREFLDRTRDWGVKNDALIVLP